MIGSQGTDGVERVPAGTLTWLSLSDLFLYSGTESVCPQICHLFMSVLTHPLSSFWNRVIHFFYFFHFPVYFLCIVLVVKAIYTHSASMIEMNWDRIKTLRVHQWRRWQEAAKNNPIASHTHNIHSRRGQTHAVSSPISWATSLWKIVSLIFLFTSWLWNSIYPIITPLSLTISIQIIRKNWKRTQNSVRQHFHSVKILPNISSTAFQWSSRGGCPKRKMHKRLSKLTGETLKYLDVLNDPVNEEIQQSLGDWGLSMWFAYNDTVGSFYWLHMKNTCKCIFTPIQTCFNYKMQMRPIFLL